MTRKPGIAGRRGRLVVCVAAGTATLAFPAVVFACTSQATITVAQAAAPAGSQATVSGVSFTAAPVQLHWNGLDGILLATVNGPNFTAPVTVPATGSGFYYMVASQRVGGQTFVARAAFEVTAPAAPGGGAATGASQPRTNTAPTHSRAPAPAALRGPVALQNRAPAAAPAPVGAAGVWPNRTISHDSDRIFAPQRSAYARPVIGRTGGGPSPPIVGAGVLAVISMVLLAAVIMGTRRRRGAQPGNLHGVDHTPRPAGRRPDAVGRLPRRYIYRAAQPEWLWRQEAATGSGRRIGCIRPPAPRMLRPRPRQHAQRSRGTVRPSRAEGGPRSNLPKGT